MLDLPAKSNGESIREHTDKLLAAMEEFNNLYGSSFDEKLLLAVRYACEYHDYGKSAYMFQKMLNCKNITDISEEKRKDIETMYREIGFEKNIPHGYLSPAFLRIKELREKFKDENLISVLITAIYYHHNRASEISALNLKRVIDEDLKERFPEIKISAKYYNYLLGNNIDESLWIQYAVVIGLLNKFDYYASDSTDDKLPVEIDIKYNNKNIHDLVLDLFMEKSWKIRSVQKFAGENINNNIIVIASTGIGKTEAALIWGGDSKLFYTLPLKVSINAMYSRIKTEYGFSEEKVTLLHSDALSFFMDEETDNDSNVQLRYEASRRLSYPVTVCTIDQLFTFVYKYRGCEQILATLKYSKVVIDEIQSYEPKIIAKLIYGLKILTQAGGKFAIITATLPPVLNYFISQNKIEHAPSQEFLIIDILRHKINYNKCEDFDYELIVKLAQKKKVLIICNTVKRAIEVYNKIQNDYDFENVKVLHSKFIRKHRRMLEEEIFRFAGEADTSGIRITTQLVEASLDIDFDVLFTEMCTADSLLQRMGRCYRKRDYSSETEPNIYITDNGNGYGTVYKYKDVYDRSVLYLQKYQNCFFSEKEKMGYVNDVYNTEDLKSSHYFSDIQNEINNMKNIVPFIITKEESKQSFRSIEPSYPTVPISIYNKLIDKFDEIKLVLSGEIKASFKERQNARNFIEDHSLNISTIYDNRCKYCSASVLGSINYYTIDYRYDFDEESLSGQGLTYDILEDDNFM